MLGLFKKKVIFSEIISNGVDIHNHILPGIDDGAHNIEESLYLINGLVDLNIVHAIATPHIMSGYYENNLETIKEAAQLLDQHLNIANFTFDYSAEYMMDDQFNQHLYQKKLLTHNEQYVLVEMSYAYETPHFEQIIFEIQSAGYQPIIAHPERYNYWSINYDLQKLKNRNIHFQLNALALGEYYGSQINKKAMKWLEEGLYTFIGTDLHHSKHLNALKNLKIHSKLAPLVEQLWDNNRNLLLK